MDWKFRLEEARIEDYMLVLGVAAEGPYDVKVRSPKVVAVLRKTGDNRRFPIGVNSYFPLEDMDTCMVYAEYPVNIRSIFVGGTREDIVISFDFIYGDTHICAGSIGGSGIVLPNRDLRTDSAGQGKRTCVLAERVENLPGHSWAGSPVIDPCVGSASASLVFPGCGSFDFV